MRRVTRRPGVVGAGSNNDWRCIMFRHLLAIALCLIASQGLAEIRVTDITGRTVVLDGPADKVILGEGRFLAILGVLGVERPLSRVAGMMNEFRRFDPTGFDRYRAAFPEIDRVPTFGQTSEQTVSVEQAILAQPDVAIFGVQGHGPGAASRHIIKRLQAAGIPTVFIDFRQQPLRNTSRSVAIVGRVLGLDAQAEAFTELYDAEVARVTERLATAPPARCPTVLLELRVDAQQPCCITISRGMFADMVKAAGGCNVAEGLLPGAVGELSLEHVIATEPEVYIGSAIGSAGTAPGQGPARIVLGAGVDSDTARASLDRVLQRDGFRRFAGRRRWACTCPVAPFLQLAVECLRIAEDRPVAASRAVCRSATRSSVGQIDRRFPAGRPGWHLCRLSQVNTMPSAKLTLRAVKADRYLDSLCRHFARKVSVERTAEHATVAFAMGECRMSVDGEQMHFVCHAADTRALDAVKTIVTDHVIRFGELRDVTVHWTED